jgi:hypothetical protein
VCRSDTGALAMANKERKATRLRLWESSRRVARLTLGLEGVPEPAVAAADKACPRTRDCTYSPISRDFVIVMT